MLSSVVQYHDESLDWRVIKAGKAGDFKGTVWRDFLIFYWHDGQAENILYIFADVPLNLYELDRFG